MMNISAEIILIKGPILSLIIGELTLKEALHLRLMNKKINNIFLQCANSICNNIERTLPNMCNELFYSKNLSSIKKLQILSEETEEIKDSISGHTLKELLFDLQNLLQLQEDESLEIIWENWLKWRFNQKLENLPEPNANAHEIEDFLKNCDHNILQEIEFIYVTNQPRLITIPKAIEYLIGLFSVDLSENKIREVPEKLNWPPNIQSIFLRNNQIKQFPTNLPKGLNCLYIQNNKIDSIPQNFHCPERLGILQIHYNPIRIKQIPQNLQWSQALEFVSIGDNQFTNKLQKMLNRN